ncbi:MAG: AraC family transcriptional regulator [Opitutaceae bacterium]|jgi:AraC-like DNA-binding protein/mannose-6-phosphate isomerase-like protein (cupin superfamily)|nr:AraC family transcriptional regulator [Opitutaceae bacterium]
MSAATTTATTTAALHLPVLRTVIAHNAGLFISPGHGIHPDRVIDSHELVFVRSGRLGLAEEDREFTVKAGETLLLWPGRRHRGTLPYEEDLSFYWIHFGLPPGARTKRKTRKTPASLITTIPRHGHPARTERLAELFHRFLDDQESGEQPADEAALLVMLMLLEIRREVSPGAAASGSGDSLAARADRFIATHFRRGIHAGDVADAVGAHPDYVGRVYRRANRRTLSEAIHRRQIAEARTLLRDTSQNMEEIARACGFGCSRYFRKLFAGQQGMSPLAYRKLYARVHVNTR